MAATRGLCSLLVFLTCWASYAPQSFADLVVTTEITNVLTEDIYDIYSRKNFYSGYIDQALHYCST